MRTQLRENLLEQVPPHDALSETCVLGSMLIDGMAARVAIEMVKEADFYVPSHRIAFSLFKKFVENGSPLDEVVVASALEYSGHLESIGGRDVLGRWIMGTPTASNVEAYCRAVLDRSNDRNLIDVAGRIMRAVHEPSSDNALEIYNQAEEILRKSRPVELNQPRIQSARDMILKNPKMREEVIVDLLRRGEILNIIAAPKSKKSFLVLSLIMSLITPSGKWFNRFPALGGGKKVLIIDNELHPETIAARLRDAGPAYGVDPSTVMDFVDILSLRGGLVDIHGLRKYIEMIEPGKYSLVVLDAFYRFFPPKTDENDNGAIAQLYNTLDNYAAMMDSSIAVIHHMSKGFQGNKGVTDLGSGGGAQSRATDTHLALVEHQEPGAFIVKGVLRTFVEINPFVIRFKYPQWTLAEDLNPDHVKAKADGWEGNKKEPKAEKETEVSLRARVLDFITMDSANPQTAPEIWVAYCNSGVEISANKVNTILEALAVEKKIEKIAGGAGRKTTFYRK